MRVAVVLQARMGSTRLPGKVLARIGAWSVLEHCIRRLAAAGYPVIVATTTRCDDDAVEAEARRLGAETFRGDESNVLARYRDTARAFGLTHVVRATADNPFVDGDGVRRAILTLARTGADHAVESELPIGAAVEAVKVDALERSAALITDAYDREHVTSFIRRDGRFIAAQVLAPMNVRRPGLRLTVDTADDLAFVRRLHRELGEPASPAPLAAVIAAADAVTTRGPAYEPLGLGA
jgi:spore coat polysaccharide biosynthesis protein SpsF